MRILMACAAFPPFIDGGGPISALMVAKLLVGAGHDLEVVNVADREEREVVEGVPVQRLSTLNVDWNYRLKRPAWRKLAWHALENFNPRAFVVMRRQIRRFAPDLVLTDSIENVNVATWAAARSLGVPTCHILRSTFLLCWRGSMRRESGNCGKPCASCAATSVGKRLSSHLVDAVVGETAFILRRHTENGYFPNAAAHVVPGILPDPVAPAPRRASTPLRFGFLGVHDANKGLDTLAAAAHRLAADGLPHALTVAGRGGGAYAAALPARFPATTRFAGWVKPSAFLADIDVLVVPSLFEEPFGRVVVEAFGAGVPVIGARSGGIPETIADGVSGLLVPPGDDAALADAMRALIVAPERVAALSAGALAAAARYAPSAVAGAYDRVFAGLPVRSSRRAALIEARS